MNNYDGQLRYGSALDRKIEDAFKKLVEVREELRRMEVVPEPLFLEIRYSVDNIMRARQKVYRKPTHEKEAENVENV